MRNPRSWRKFWILLLTPASLLVLKGDLCTSSDQVDPHGLQSQVTVTVQNLNTPFIGEAVHIFSPYDQFPANRLEPGESRALAPQLMRKNERIEYRAGRNGTIIARKECQCTSACPKSDPNAQVGSPRVHFDESTLLSCHGW